MSKFQVTWEIDSDEETPEAAAREALSIQRRPDGTATHFKIKNKETGEATEVDLDHIDYGSMPAP